MVAVTGRGGDAADGGWMDERDGVAPPGDRGPIAAPAGVVGRGTQRLDPRIVRVWTAQGAIGAVLPAVALAGIELAVRVSGADPPWPPGVPALVVLVVGGLLAWWAPAARYRRWSYELADEALELRHGVVERVHSAIPYWRVQYIDVEQGPIERALGLSRLVVHTAAATSDAEIPGIATERAEALRQVLLARAGTGDAV
jgi:membrane protein YdbS with pleckstrin-like domain